MTSTYIRERTKADHDRFLRQMAITDADELEAIARNIGNIIDNARVSLLVEFNKAAFLCNDVDREECMRETEIALSTLREETIAVWGEFADRMRRAD